MNQERYWRNLIADEIKAEHDKVKKYYQKRGMNAGGMSNEEHTRLNIFLLSESIARTMRNSQDAPRDIPTPPPAPEIVDPVEIVDSPEIVDPTKVQMDEINDFVEEQIEGLSEEIVDSVEQIAYTMEIPGQVTIEDVRTIEDVPTIEDIVIDPVQRLVKDTPYQNEFGEIL